jgi:mannose-6-phosphate isomerase-like protein (cupin superfamily)
LGDRIEGAHRAGADDTDDEDGSMHIRTAVADGQCREGNSDVRRVYPWDGVVATPWESNIVSVRPWESTVERCSDIDETFIFTRGMGIVKMGLEQERVHEGDVVYIPRGGRHTVTNIGDDDLLTFVNIRWLQNVWA